jgi:phosphatidylserine/phosphatidylglycerophosphate/cardiolipin synthase-like enzyme
VADSSHRSPEVEVVVTLSGDDAPLLLSRHGLRTTFGVVTELLAASQEQIVIAAPYMQEAGLCDGAIGMALQAALERGVRVDLITSRGSLGAPWPRRLEGVHTGRVRVLIPTDNAHDSRVLGSHAKFVLCDGKRAYVGSANLTTKGMTEHIELGVLLEGRPAKKIMDFVATLLETGRLLTVEESGP